MHSLSRSMHSTRLCNLKFYDFHISDVSHGHFNFQSNVRAAVSRRHTRFFLRSQRRLFIVYTHVTTIANITCTYLQKCSTKSYAALAFRRRNKWKFGAKFVTLKVAQMGEWKVNTYRQRSFCTPSPILCVTNSSATSNRSQYAFCRRSQHVNFHFFIAGTDSEMNFDMTTEKSLYTKQKSHSRFQTPDRPWPILSLKLYFFPVELIAALNA